MKEILKTYPNLVYLFIIVIALAIVLFACVALKQLGFEKIRAKVYKLFVVAENNFKKGDNDEKFEWVVKMAKDAIPAPFNVFITENALRKTIQLWFDMCKDLLDDGRINNIDKYDLNN